MAKAIREVQESLHNMGANLQQKIDVRKIESVEVQKRVKVQYESLQALSERVKQLDTSFASLSHTVNVHMERVQKVESRIDPLLHGMRQLSELVQQVQNAQKELSLAQVVSSDGRDPHMVQAEKA